MATNSETLLLINSILLSLVGLLFFAVGYFLRNLHKDFKHVVDRVNNINGDLKSHLLVFEKLTGLFKEQIKGLKKRVKQIERIVTRKK